MAKIEQLTRTQKRFLYNMGNALCACSFSRRKVAVPQLQEDSAARFKDKEQKMNDNTDLEKRVEGLESRHEDLGKRVEVLEHALADVMQGTIKLDEVFHLGMESTEGLLEYMKRIQPVLDKLAEFHDFIKPDSTASDN
jgi:chaperonin cofactor prefoldin